ncbi:MAG: hypothetical protein V7L20_26650 [Nostoc sp.]|uniref:hypothetical protein n=1 Tax=Nostoc sp. TaxID=1180 RepID=UPI002FF5D890
MSLVNIGQYFFNPKDVVFVDTEYIECTDININLSDSELAGLYPESERPVLVKLKWDAIQGQETRSFVVYNDEAKMLRKYFKDVENPDIQFLNKKIPPLGRG